MSTRPILVMAGGTGGHVFPGLAVARALIDHGVPVAWLGTRRGLEAKLVPPAGIPVEYVSIGGLRGKGLTTLLLAPFRLLIALFQCLLVMLRLRPSAVLGMGGFVTGPGGLAAWLSRRPLVIHEQNAVAGLTNRILSLLAKDVLEAFPASFPGRANARVVGNPVRRAITAVADPDARFAGRSGRPHLLVFGGSQGALCLNQTVAAAIASLPEKLRPEIRHQAGERTLDVASAAYVEAGVEATVTPFIEDMAAAYSWADLAICRSGALTVSELAAAGVGSVLVPFAAAVDDHQTRNAAYLVDEGAACIVQERDLDAATLAAILSDLLVDRGRLLEMGRAARRCARPDSLQRLESACLAAAGMEARP